MSSPQEPPPPYPGKQDYPPEQPYPPAQPYLQAQPFQPYPTGQPYPVAQPYPAVQQQYAPAGSTVVVTQPTTVLAQVFRECPVQTVCPSCHQSICTTTMYETGTFAWLLCVILFLIGCGWGCCLIPFCVDGAKDVVHSCPSCNHVIGRYNRL